MNRSEYVANAYLNPRNNAPAVAAEVGRTAPRVQATRNRRRVGWDFWLAMAVVTVVSLGPAAYAAL